MVANQQGVQSSGSIGGDLISNSILSQATCKPLDQLSF